MKKVFLSIAVLVMSLGAFAQLSKEEQKEWGKKMKSTSVEDFKDLVEGKDEAEATQADLELDISSLNEENSRLQQELDDLKSKLEETETTAATTEENVATEDTEVEIEESTQEARPAQDAISGLHFRVQIGAYKEFDLRKYFDNHKNFSGEIDEDGTMRYTIGAFSDYWEADQFKKYLREMGVKGAWVVSYKDGARIPIKDALEGAH